VSPRRITPRQHRQLRFLRIPTPPQATWTPTLGGSVHPRLPLLPLDAGLRQDHPHSRLFNGTAWKPRGRKRRQQRQIFRRNQRQRRNWWKRSATGGRYASCQGEAAGTNRDGESGAGVSKGAGGHGARTYQCHFGHGFVEIHHRPKTTTTRPRRSWSFRRSGQEEKTPRTVPQKQSPTRKRRRRTPEGRRARSGMAIP